MTREKFEERRKKDKEYKRKKYHSDTIFRNNVKLNSSKRRKNINVIKIQKEYIKKWRENNIEKCKAYRYNHLIKNKKNPIFRLRRSMSTLIRNSFKFSKSKKKSKTADILGCSIEQFKAHIESQFQPGMSWDNRHLWHIDHIMPVSMAKTYDEVVRLNHYKNLRPMWAEENISKSDKTPDVLVLF